MRLPIQRYTWHNVSSIFYGRLSCTQGLDGAGGQLSQGEGRAYLGQVIGLIICVMERWPSKANAFTHLQIVNELSITFWGRAARGTWRERVWGENVNFTQKGLNVTKPVKRQCKPPHHDATL